MLSSLLLFEQKYVICCRNYERGTAVQAWPTETGVCATVMNNSAFNSSTASSSKFAVRSKWNQRPTTKLWRLFQGLLLWRLCYLASVLAKRFLTANDRNLSKMKCYSQRTEADVQLGRLRRQTVGRQIRGELRLLVKGKNSYFNPILLQLEKRKFNKNHRNENSF